MTTQEQIIAEGEQEKIDDLFKLIGFDDQKIIEHRQRLGKILLMSIVDNLENLTALKENKAPFPEKIESVEDLFKYYEQYTDKETIEKMIKENVVKIYSEYFDSILDELK